MARQKIGDVLCAGPAGAVGSCLMISAGVGMGAAWARRINIICALALAFGALISPRHGLSKKICHARQFSDPFAARLAVIAMTASGKSPIPAPAACREA